MARSSFASRACLNARRPDTAHPRRLVQAIVKTGPARLLRAVPLRGIKVANANSVGQSTYEDIER